MENTFDQMDCEGSNLLKFKIEIRPLSSLRCKRLLELRVYFYLTTGYILEDFTAFYASHESVAHRRPSVVL